MVPSTIASATFKHTHAALPRPAAPPRPQTLRWRRLSGALDGGGQDGDGLFATRPGLRAAVEALAEQRDQLRTAQRLWIQYRDANCLYYDLGEGTIARLDAGECMRSMTEVRAKELENLGHQ